MSDCVLDASAMVLALSGKTDASAALRARLVGVRRHAPHLIDAEVGNVLRRHEREGRLSPDEALLGLRAAHALVDHRYAHVGPLAELAWTWRQNLSFYDALYVSLAVLLDVPLVTADVRLSGAPEVSCTIELV
ncbi:MAG: type II toxin-antitoxin system VapC family toxin [Acidimicrobiales bacterium]